MEVLHGFLWKPSHNSFSFFFFTETTDGITPTIGFSNSSFSLHRFHVSLFDVGGGARIRAIWKNYYAEVRNYENCSQLF